MKLSVITATFNAVRAGRAEMLERCVRSVAALKTPHEHLVYDGASTDGTVELLRRLERECPGVKVTSEPDTGIYNAFNKAVAAAAGEWVYFLGDDDYLLSPETLDGVMDEVGDGVESFVLSPVERPGIPQTFTSWKSMRSILTVTPYCHQGVLMRKALVGRLGGFDERFPISADYDLLLKAHFANVPFRCVWKTYAFFNSIGVSAASEKAHRDMTAVTSARLRLDEAQRRVFFDCRLLPLGKILPLLWHRSAVVRLGARHALKRRVAWWLGLLDEAGNPRKRR